MSSGWQSRFNNGSGLSGNPLGNFDRGEIKQPQSVLTNPYNRTDSIERKMFLKNRKNPKAIFPEEQIVEDEEMDIGRMVKVRGKEMFQVLIGCFMV